MRIQKVIFACDVDKCKFQTENKESIVQVMVWVGSASNGVERDLTHRYIDLCVRHAEEYAFKAFNSDLHENLKFLERVGLSNAGVVK